MALGTIPPLIEIWETTLAVLLFLVIGGAITLVYNPDIITAKTLDNELSYISTLKSGKDFEISMNSEKINNLKINSNKENEIIVEVGSKEVTKNYIGEQVKITQESDKIIIT